MKLQFAKMHGLGNDFVVIDERANNYGLAPDTLARLADRRLGVGCDQVLFLEPANNEKAIARYRVANADGSEAEHCGNGIRCIAAYLARRGEVSERLWIEVGDEVFELYFTQEQQVCVEMGVPQFEPQDIPLNQDSRIPRYQTSFDGASFEFGAVSMGNPHAVIEVDNVDEYDVAPVGRLIQSSNLFPEGVNVGFMQTLSSAHVRLRVFERGVGETRACGTGACAAVAIGRRWGVLDDLVAVDLTGGRLAIHWDGSDSNQMTMTGPATFVYEGTIEL